MSITMKNHIKANTTIYQLRIKLLETYQALISNNQSKSLIVLKFPMKKGSQNQIFLMKNIYRTAAWHWFLSNGNKILKKKTVCQLLISKIVLCGCQRPTKIPEQLMTGAVQNVLHSPKKQIFLLSHQQISDLSQ